MLLHIATRFFGSGSIRKAPAPISPCFSFGMHICLPKGGLRDGCLAAIGMAMAMPLPQHATAPDPAPAITNSRPDSLVMISFSFTSQSRSFRVRTATSLVNSRVCLCGPEP